MKQPVFSFGDMIEVEVTSRHPLTGKTFKNVIHGVLTAIKSVEAPYKNRHYLYGVSVRYGNDPFTWLPEHEVIVASPNDREDVNDVDG